MTGDSPHKLQLSWSPPFSLPGETISYSLLIQDLATGLNRTVEPLSLTVFTHQLSEMKALACHYFIFSVFSLNEVGLSINSSSSTPVLHPSGETHSIPHTLQHYTYHSHTFHIHYIQLYVQNTTANVHIYNITAMYKLTCNRLLQSEFQSLSLSQLPGLWGQWRLRYLTTLWKILGTELCSASPSRLAVSECVSVSE